MAMYPDHPTMLPEPLTGHHVFVYGTLRRGQLRDINLLKPAPVWLGQGTVVGTLYDLGHYPGMVLGHGAGSGLVQGEVYAVGLELEQLLDEIEEVWPQQTGEYCKRLVEVQIREFPVGGPKPETPATLTCFAYEINPLRIKEQALIVKGDWVEYLQSPGL